MQDFSPANSDTLPSVFSYLTPDTRLRGRSRHGAAKARHLKPLSVTLNPEPYINL